MADVVKPSSAPRTRRAEQAERTRARIVEAAARLFLERGYAATTVEAIAGEADVAIETVYARFRSKVNVLGAILEPAIVGGSGELDLLARPEIARIRATGDQRDQIRQLARYSRSIIERSFDAHRILESAVFSDPAAAELAQADTRRRLTVQRSYIAMLLANGPLRVGLTAEQAADTYSALASPYTWDLLVRQQERTPAQFEQWLTDCLLRLLL
jgi:AcrR family transcriptional regulator